MIKASGDYKLWKFALQALKGQAFADFADALARRGEVSSDWRSAVDQTAAKIQVAIERHGAAPGDFGVAFETIQMQLLIAALEVQVARLRMCLLWAAETSEGLDANDGGFLTAICECLRAQLSSQQ
jgi:hypothetical protein